MVVMLKEKTQGNLTDELEQIQSMMLSELESNISKNLKQPKPMDQPNNSISPLKDKKSRRVIILLSVLLSLIAGF